MVWWYDRHRTLGFDPILWRFIQSGQCIHTSTECKYNNRLVIVFAFNWPQVEGHCCVTLTFQGQWLLYSLDLTYICKVDLIMTWRKYINYYYDYNDENSLLLFHITTYSVQNISLCEQNRKKILDLCWFDPKLVCSWCIYGLLWGCDFKVNIVDLWSF